MAKGKKKKAKKKDVEEVEKNAATLNRILKLYEHYSSEQRGVTCPDVVKHFRTQIDEGESLQKVFIRPILKAPKLRIPVVTTDVGENDSQIVETIPNTFVRPFVQSIIDTELSTLKEFSVWGLCMNLLDCVELGRYLKLPMITIQSLYLRDCAIQPDSLEKLSPSFNVCRTLRTLNLDYNCFGDDGCIALCLNLIHNRTITSLSLTYCDISALCGQYLSRLLLNTAISEIYLDGNQLGCQGALALIKDLLHDCEKFTIEKLDKLRIDEEMKAQEALLREQQGLDPEPTAKKKKKKKKKKKSDEPPPVGPFVSKIHLFDNEIDHLQRDGLIKIREVIEAYARLIEISEELEELDLDENVIGNVCGNMILEALKNRKKNKLKSIKINVSEKIDQYVFGDILKLSKKMKKKRKRTKKKK